MENYEKFIAEIDEVVKQIQKITEDYSMRKIPAVSEMEHI